jgi:hypothetical protein
MNRDQAIQTLIEIGCKDLTSEMHPNKVGKHYFRYTIARGSSINFNIDYDGYDRFFVSYRRRHIEKMITFNELPTFLAEMKIIN